MQPEYVAGIGHAGMAPGPLKREDIETGDVIPYTAEDLCALLNTWRDFYAMLVKAGVINSQFFPPPHEIPAMCEHGPAMHAGQKGRWCPDCEKFYPPGSRPFNL